MTASPTGASWQEGEAFLAAHPEVDAIDLVLTDLHGIGRGKIIRRHELKAVFESGRGIPSTIFAQDIEGNDIDGAVATMREGGGDWRCWPVAGTLGLQMSNGRGLVLLQMFGADGKAVPHDPRGALGAQVARAGAAGLTPKGALELEFYLLDSEPDGQGRAQPIKAALGGRRLDTTNCMSVDELDEMSPFFEAVYSSAAAFGLPLESLISEYAPGQFELTLRYRDILQAVDELILTKQILRSTARRFGMRTCFMAKPFGDQTGCGMHLHLSMEDSGGRNVFADPASETLAPSLMHAIGGVREAMRDTMLIFAPTLNSWRRFASAVYSPASNSWAVEDRGVALRVPESEPAARRFEHRLAGVDANPYLVAAITLGAALDGMERRTDPGPQNEDDARFAALPRGWGEAIEAFETSEQMKTLLGAPLHTSLSAIKRSEHDKLASHVSEIEWTLYGYL